MHQIRKFSLVWAYDFIYLFSFPFHSKKMIFRLLFLMSGWTGLSKVKCILPVIMTAEWCLYMISFSRWTHHASFILCFAHPYQLQCSVFPAPFPGTITALFRGIYNPRFDLAPHKNPARKWTLRARHLEHSPPAALIGQGFESEPAVWWELREILSHLWDKKRPSLIVTYNLFINYLFIYLFTIRK